MRAFAILNLKAATDDAMGAAVKAARAAGHALHVRVVYEGEDFDRFVEQALAAGAERILVAGGDGSQNATVRALYRRGADTPIAPLPWGTANDFATACGVAQAPEAAFRAALSEPPRRVDLGLANGEPFLNVASLGVSARATAEVDPTAKRVLGDIAYWFKGIKEGVAGQAVTARVSGPDLSWSGPLLSMTVANARLAGGGVVVGPRSALDDGLLDVLLVPELTLGERSQLAAQALDPEWATTSELVRYVQLDRLEVTLSERTPMNLDGEPQVVTEVVFSVAPEAAQVVVPQLPPLSAG